MKRIALAAIAAATFAAPLAIATSAAADPPRQVQRDRDDNRGDRADNNRRGDSRADNNRRGDQRADNNRRGGDRWDDRRDDRNNRWDDRRYNGYVYNGRFFRGPPPANLRNARFEQRNWRRGERLSQYHRSHYRQVDWRRERLRAPPRGYNYVRDDRGDVILAAVATGLILSVILANN